MKRVFYEKVGRRYKAVAEYDSDLVGSLPEGAHLIVVRPGLKSTLFQVDPAYAAVEAALKEFKDQVASLIIEAQKLQPPRDRKLTKTEQEVYDFAKERLHKEAITLGYYNCVYDVLEKGMEFLREKSNKG